MNVTLYSTGCPKCSVLETKLKENNIVFDIINDVETMQNLGFMSLPMLDVDGEIMDFGSAVRWVNGV